MKFKFLRLLLFFIILVNLGLAFLTFFYRPEFIKIINSLYGTNLGILEAHTIYIIKMMGCFLFAVSFMSFFALKNPVKYYPIVYANGLWLLLRGIQRINYIEAFHNDWGLSYTRLWFSAVFVIVYAILLFFLANSVRKYNEKTAE